MEQVAANDEPAALADALILALDLEAAAFRADASFELCTEAMEAVAKARRAIDPHLTVENRAALDRLCTVDNDDRDNILRAVIVQGYGVTSLT